ncbi:Splicing factor 3B subunit 6 [Entomophthora muscae]|uniref:Splicing factor 3B subunit 6 n=1 Tax=Entomophthora muscae TaxID=34485 RepID=A0ACC2RMV2_9FUNG|nr:Splicing factor 3B subunit 6 [Entomophthora muscae]
MVYRQCRNLPFKINSEDIYDLFGKYGAVRQVRLGNTNETRGTGFVVYEDIFRCQIRV